MGASTVTGKGKGSAEGPVRGDIGQILKVVDSATELTIHNQDGQHLVLDRGTGGSGFGLTTVYVTDPTYTANCGECVIADATSNPVAITLPAASGCENQLVAVKPVFDVGTVTVTSPDLIEVSVPYTCAYVGEGSFAESLVFISDGTNWFIIADYERVEGQG